MSGGGAGPIIIRNLRAALSVGCNRTGSVRLWYVLVATHLLAFAAGWLV